MISWIKTHKLTTVLFLIVGYFLVKNWFGASTLGMNLRSMSSPSFDSASIGGAMPKSAGGMMGVAERGIFPPPDDTGIPPSESTNRLVIRDTSMSMVVKNVSDSLKSIQVTAERLGGFLVNSNLDKPEESANGSITVRVPDTKLAEALEEFRRVGLRVINEQVNGRDVTDEYVDLDARLATLNKTKEKFEEILDRATTVQDLLNVQQQLISLQSQIDSAKGQQQYLSQSAKLSRITVFLSTDEFSLPYAPAQPWRPNVVVKLAIRSLVTNLRSFGTAVIWIGVYAVIWGPIAGVVWMVRKRRGKG